jgi:xylulokinase
MHGLVVVDRNLDILRPAIIWCDSRAVESGDEASVKLGDKWCLNNLLNLPGNFTASKLDWVRRNEPDLFARIHKAMLPGEYIGMRLTGKIVTTISGLSEGVFWDFKTNTLSDRILDCFGIDPGMLPEIAPSFGHQGEIASKAASELGLREGVPVTYRAGDQPNNAFALNVLQPGEIAASGGTSGVIYGITDKPAFDPESRVNVFAHVNYTPESPRYGILLCINGTGILNRWLRDTLFKVAGFSYTTMNELGSQAPIGSDGLVFIPYGNGSERTLGNQNPGSSLHNLDFNRHDSSHIIRAAQEGIVFALNYGFEIMQGMGIDIDVVRACRTGLFLSPLFREAFSNTINARLELYNTDGSQGAARGAAVGAGIYTIDNAFIGLERAETIEPDSSLSRQYRSAYLNWRAILDSLLNRR